MPNRGPPRADWDDEDDEGWDSNGDEPDDEETDDGEPTVPCPYCRREIHEDASRCPYCEQYISAEDAPASPKPLWIVLGAIVCLLMMYFWVFRFPRW